MTHFLNEHLFFHYFLNLYTLLFSLFLLFSHFSIFFPVCRWFPVIYLQRKKKEARGIFLSFFLLSFLFSTILVSVVFFCRFQVLSRFQFFEFIKDHIVEYFDVGSFHAAGSGLDHTGTLEFSERIYNN